MYFKSIILLGAAILKLQGKNLPELYKLVDSNNSKNIFRIHALGKLFPYIQVVLENVWGPWPNEENITSLQEAKKIVNDLDNVDKEGFSFRYPINKDGSPCRPRKIRFNVIDFSYSLKKFGEFLENSYLGLSEVLDNYCEYLSQQQSQC